MDSGRIDLEVEALEALPEKELSEYACSRLKCLKEELKWRETRPLTEQEKDMISNSYKKLVEANAK
jgi:hypothetical protein